MSQDSRSTSKGKRRPPEENLQDEAAFQDLVVTDEDLTKHTSHADRSVTHEQVRDALSNVAGSFADELRKERDGT